jgi:hypothetical protein
VGGRGLLTKKNVGNLAGNQFRMRRFETELPMNQKQRLEVAN